MAALSEWKSFPRAPGTYLMMDGRGKVLYVGKAKDLRARLSAYAAGGRDGRPRIPHLVRQVAAVRCIVTSTEKEALLLENTLIKEHRPPYNVFLRDDKEYLLLRIDRRSAFPRPELVRRVAKDGAAYFGPFSSSRAVRETLRELHRLFPLCSCSRKRFAARTRPCLNHQMGRCLGACAGLVDPADYREVVEEAIRFLKGNYRGVLRRWKEEMGRLAAQTRYEEAAKFRDRIASVEQTLRRQRVVRAVPGDVDAVGWHREGEEVTAAVLHVREGRLTDAHDWRFRAAGADDEALSSFLSQHYREGAFLPAEILLPAEPPSGPALASVLSDRAGRPVRIRVPRNGERARLVTLAGRNAEEAHRMRKEREATYERTAERLAALLGLPRPPVRIEGFDVSLLSGGEAVGSRVVFVGGKAAKSWYRKFAIRGIEGADDFAMIGQVVRRRFGHGEDFGERPDLLLIDGGKGQLGAAMAGMVDAGAPPVPVVALAKERTRGGTTVFRERIFLPGRKNPLVPVPSDPALLLLQRVRDEAHRFALAYHRARRGKKALS